MRLKTVLADGKEVVTESVGAEAYQSGVFSLGREIDCDRYATPAEALRGHAALVKKWADEYRKASTRS